MIDLTVKTLDSQNHTFSLNDDITVRQFKEHIAETVSIPADLQRLIYCGRVLQDEKNLNEYDVNGKVIHLVQRAPPSLHQRSSDANQSGNQGTQGGSWQSGPRIQYRPGRGNPMYVGSVSIPADVLDRHDAEWPTPQFSGLLANSHLTVVHRMLDQANRVIDRLENTETPESTPQTSAPTPGSSEAPAPAEQPSQTDEIPATGSAPEPDTNDILVPRPLAELLEKLLTTQDRLRPYIRDRLLSTTSSSPDESQRIIESVSECLHFLSHAQHALSNISIDMQQTPPRTLRCRPMNIRPPAVVQAGLPIQVEAHIEVGQSDNNNTDETNQTPQTTPASNDATSSQNPPSTTPRQERSGQSDSPFGQVFNFPNNVEVVMEMGTQAPGVWSLEYSTGPQPLGTMNNNNNTNNNNTNTNNNNTTNGAGTSGLTRGAALSPDLLRNLMQAVAGYIFHTGGPLLGTASVPTTASTTPPSATSGCIHHRGRNAGESASSQPRGNTDTHPTTSTQTRTTSRTHVLQHAQALGVGLDVADSIDFDPFLPCTSQHVRRQPAQTSTAASTQTGQGVAGGEGQRTLGNREPRFATFTGVQIVNRRSNRLSLAEFLANAERIGPPSRPLSFNTLLLNRGINLLDYLNRPTILQRVYLVLSKLSLGDWRKILGGDYSPITPQVQEALRTNIREIALVEDEELPNRIARRVVLDLRIDIRCTFFVENLREHADVNMLNTIDRVLSRYIEEILRCLFTSYETNTAFAEAVVNQIKLLAADLIGICRLILIGGQNGFERVVARFARRMTCDSDALWRDWILGPVVEWICNYSRGVVSPPKEEIMKMICYKDSTNTTTSQSEPTATETASSPSATPPAQSPVESVPEPMETETAPDPLMPDENEEVSTTFPGHESLLPDWVPIIARDGARQRRQLQLGLSGGSVTSLSDAYLATMPSKRRKLVEQQKPTLLASPTSNSSAIPASMERLIRESVGRAGVEEIDGAAAAVASDTTARRAFGEAIRECLHPHRYQSPDFPDPLRFPNATKFFSDHDRHDK
uniref:Large proline-rich protein BAG6 n=2 Tax=Fopius arisanus TaxID=64838 RepID=A0A0C9R207_9HYME